MDCNPLSDDPQWAKEVKQVLRETELARARLWKLLSKRKEPLEIDPCSGYGIKG
jgi:hypothetical protein